MIRQINLITCFDLFIFFDLKTEGCSQKMIPKVKTLTELLFLKKQWMTEPKEGGGKGG